MVGPNLSGCVNSCPGEEKVLEVEVRFPEAASLYIISVNFLVDNIWDVKVERAISLCVTVTCLVYIYTQRRDQLWYRGSRLWPCKA